MRLLTLAPLMLSPGDLTDRELTALMSALCDLIEERGGWGMVTNEAAQRFAKAVPEKYRGKLAGEFRGFVRAMEEAPEKSPLRLLASGE